MMNLLKKLYESFKTISIHESVYDFFLLVQFFFITCDLLEINDICYHSFILEKSNSGNYKVSPTEFVEPVFFLLVNTALAILMVLSATRKKNTLFLMSIIITFIFSLWCYINAYIIILGYATVAVVNIILWHIFLRICFPYNLIAKIAIVLTTGLWTGMAVGMLMACFGGLINIEAAISIWLPIIFWCFWKVFVAFKERKCRI